MSLENTVLKCPHCFNTDITPLPGHICPHCMSPLVGEEDINQILEIDSQPSADFNKALDSGADTNAMPLVDYDVAEALMQGVKQDIIINELVKKNMTREEATQLVKKFKLTVEEYKKTPEGRSKMAAKYARHMIFGLLWAIAGTVITVWTYQAASDGGVYVVAWGAILFGIIDFFTGLLGWLKYSV